MQRKFVKSFAYAKVFFITKLSLLLFPLFLLKLKSVDDSFLLSSLSISKFEVWDEKSTTIFDVLSGN